MCMTLGTYKIQNLEDSERFPLLWEWLHLVSWGGVWLPFLFEQFSLILAISSPPMKAPKDSLASDTNSRETQRYHKVEDHWIGQRWTQNNDGRSSGINAHSNINFLKAHCGTLNRGMVSKYLLEKINQCQTSGYVSSLSFLFFLTERFSSSYNFPNLAVCPKQSPFQSPLPSLQSFFLK